MGVATSLWTCTAADWLISCKYTRAVELGSRKRFVCDRSCSGMEPHIGGHTALFIGKAPGFSHGKPFALTVQHMNNAPDIDSVFGSMPWARMQASNVSGLHLSSCLRHFCR